MRESSHLSREPVAPRQGFLCYCHKDRRYAERLLVHFASCKLRSGLTIWDDSQIQAGSLWEREITSALEKADFAILLVSADFLASSFITTVELPHLLSSAKSGGTRILPVILGHCMFKESDLAAFQAVNDPDEPLKDLTASARDKVWVSVIRALLSATH